MRNDVERLRDILEAISQIEKYAIQGQTEFQNNELIQVWVVHHLQIIGEAANSLSQKLITQHSRVPWSQIIAFRNILVHEYFRVDLKAVWKIIERDLPHLKHQVVDILNNK
ncbi:MAG: DUF86 domain-containing protein [Pleurocapsa minor HA4230-MV1]|jgi:uncharacterized protein with HEPN domain|nr:DUF86 domain-containing protein [Pleurocapsa minor HA4230-MV1]